MSGSPDRGSPRGQPDRQQEMPETMPLSRDAPSPLPVRRRAALLALAGLLLCSAPAVAVETGAVPEAAPSAADCPARYQPKLQAIAEGPYAALKAAKPALAGASDGRLGAFIFPPQSTRRTTQEVNALRAAGTLVRMQGGGNWMANPESRWIVEQIRTDLGEYLSQPASPYLCGGVAGYVDQLRTYRDRVAVSPRRFAALAGVQEAAARRSLTAALDAVSLFRDGPAAGLRTGDAAAPAAPAGAAAPGPTAAIAPASLLDEEARLVALDTLVRAAAGAGLLPGDLAGPSTSGAVPPAGATPVAGVPRPVLGRLAGLRQPILTGLKSPQTQGARRALMIAFSDVEMLDHLAQREDGAPDPVLAAIDETLDAILRAHDEACACTTETAAAGVADPKPALR
ncbi:hypothetical protein [Aurantimonas sp. Leaf443]|uniref:hypothetical protein n=1 Tax=Aurantimonas sp. Leaf443 TaxID=1736378 RepID=UPI0006F225D1|nr:hypothetical protein [Aurantimonas sp. Leaf443]KQT87933.1 hypothetical protein ASG48_00230 [Aurantimonas sp. Leaf443]